MPLPGGLQAPTSLGQHPTDWSVGLSYKDVAHDISETCRADCVLCCPDSPCYCLQWTKLLFRWAPDRQGRQRRRWKKDPDRPGLCPPDCPGGGKGTGRLALFIVIIQHLGDTADVSFSSSPCSQKACPENTLTVSSSVPMVSVDTCPDIIICNIFSGDQW